MLLRKRMLTVTGAIALMTAVSTTILFILYSASTSPQPSIQAISIISAALNCSSCVTIALFTFITLQQTKTFRLCGAVPSIFSIAVSTVTLGRIITRRGDPLPNVVGQNPSSIAIAGFAILVIAVMAQTLFWTTCILSPSCNGPVEVFDLPKPNEHDEPFVNFSFPSRLSPTHKSTVKTTVHELKYHPHVTQISHSSSPKPSYEPPVRVSSTSSIVLQNAHTSIVKVASPQVLETEINHFDDWETSDVHARERVADSLAAAEREELDNVTVGGLTAAPARCGRSLSVSTIYENEVHTVGIDRQNSPPLPENELSPRSAMFTIPPRAVLASPVTLNFTLPDARVCGGDAFGGTGKWLGRMV